MEKIKLAYILTPVLSNKVAYLIATGGTHNGVQINGIGENKMFDIFYYANTDELNATSNFAELRVAYTSGDTKVWETIYRSTSCNDITSIK